MQCDLFTFKCFRNIMKCVNNYYFSLSYLKQIQLLIIRKINYQGTDHVRYPRFYKFCYNRALKVKKNKKKKNQLINSCIVMFVLAYT